MEKFSEILEKFSSKQRLFVLTLLLVFTSGTYLVTNYTKTDDCQPIIEKNNELIKHNAELITYIVQIQDMIMVYKETKTPAEKSIYSPSQFRNIAILDSIMKVTEKAIK